MRLDYDEEKIFSWTISTVAIMAITGLVGYWVVYRVIGFWVVIAILGGVYLLRKWSKKHDWDFWEWLDYVGGWMLMVGTVVFFSWGPEMWVYGVGYLVSLIVVKILARNYRKIRWYTSGKPGFSGLAAIICIAVVDILADFTGDRQLYFLGITARQWLAAWLLTGSTVVLYLRGKLKA